MRKILLMMTAILSAGLAYAQNLQVTGIATSAEDGSPMPAVAVAVQSTGRGTTTDLDGAYSISVPADGTLVFSFLGYDDAIVPVNGRTVINVSLQPGSIMIDDVVITALGISKAEKAIGYAATTIKADDIIAARTTNAANALAGKVAGVQIQSTSSDPGASSNIIIRGFNSISGSNQPLYVVDGVPLQNTVTYSGEKSTALGGISNIPSEDIESMTILKGAAATALYGSRAANGVVVITTKNGKKGQGRNYMIAYSGGLQVRQVSVFPELQNDFGQGWNGTQTFIENGSWGPALDGSTQVYGPIWNNQQRIHDYSAVPTNVKDFFDLGISNNHNVSLSGVSDDSKMTYYLSYSYNKDNGIMPYDYDVYKRNTIAYRSTYQAAKWLKLSSSMNFARAKSDVVSTFQGASVIDGLYELPRDMSIYDMRDLSVAFNTPEAYLTPYGITNPYWAIANNYNHNDSKQVFGKMQIDVNPIKDLTLTYRMGFDYTDYDSKVGYPEIALDDALIQEDYGYAPSEMNQSGYVAATYGRTYETNHDFLANYSKKAGDLDLGVILGVNINERASTGIAGQTDKLTFETGFWDLSNGATKTTLEETQAKRRLVGAFADITLGWNDMLFLELTARNDWSSTLPIGANHYFYPGATLSWVFSSLLDNEDVLSNGKFRLAYGKTGNDAPAYRTSASYVQAFANGYYYNSMNQFPMNGTNAFIKGATMGSTSLSPEMTTEFEAGLNLDFYKGLVGLDFTFYNRTTDDLIFSLPVDPATGYQRMYTNFGSINNKGFEMVLNLTPVKTSDFRWDLGFNFSKNWNKVLSLPEGLDEGKSIINSFSAGDDAVYVYAEEGKPLGQFYTYLPTYTDDGKIIVGTDGLPILTKEVKDTGKSMQNDWTGGITTSLSYKGITLSGVLDIRYGGYMFSRTKNLMQFTGNGAVTTYNDRKPFIIPNSVVKEGNEYVPNETPIYLANSSYQNYFDKKGAGLGGEFYLIDRSFAKIRSISLSYEFPKSTIKPLSLSGLTMTAFCNNPYVWTAKTNRYIDPETTSYADDGDLGAQFGELYSNPACRTFGFNINITF